MGNSLRTYSLIQKRDDLNTALFIGVVNECIDRNLSILFMESILVF